MLSTFSTDEITSSITRDVNRDSEVNAVTSDPKEHVIDTKSFEEDH